MKTHLIYLILLAIFCQRGHSQGMPVYDNTNFLTLGKSLIESGKQTTQLLKTVDFLREQKERLQQVSSVIRQLEAVEEIVRIHRLLFDLVEEDLEEIRSSPHIRSEEAARITASFTSILDMSLENASLVQQLLTSGGLNMTDADRLSILVSQKERSRKLLAEVRLRSKRYQDLISFRKVRDRLTRRTANH